MSLVGLVGWTNRIGRIAGQLHPRLPSIQWSDSSFTNVHKSLVFRRLSHATALNQISLPDGPARTRFAPSPTGYLHLGSLRTALFNYLLAKKTGGQFILRIEDTDRKRLVHDAEERLCQDLTWAGLSWDEGPGVDGPDKPYRQSERTHLYQESARVLLKSGAAFRCFCAPDASTEPTAVPLPVSSQLDQSISGCQHTCDELAVQESTEKADDGAKFVVRLKKTTRIAPWHDLVYGKIKPVRKSASHSLYLPDAVLLKSDGTPTYHLANVVDDHAMRITHVIRGTEWMNSTALHVSLYTAFGWPAPQFAHVGLLTDAEGNKLSKRRLDTDVRSLRDEGNVLPETLANFLALLGWRNTGKKDVISFAELVKEFNLRFTRGNTIVSFDKLRYLQRHHAKIRIQNACTNEEAFTALVSQIEKELKERRSRSTTSRVLQKRDLRTHISAVLFADSECYENAAQYLERNRFFFNNSDARISYHHENSGPEQIIVEMLLNDNAIRQQLGFWERIESHLTTQELSEKIQQGAGLVNGSIARLCQQAVRRQWASSTNQITVNDEVEIKAQKALSKQVHAYLRQGLTFGLPSPSTGHVMAVLGYDECLRRISVLKDGGC